MQDDHRWNDFKQSCSWSGSGRGSLARASLLGQLYAIYFFRCLGAVNGRATPGVVHSRYAMPLNPWLLDQV